MWEDRGYTGIIPYADEVARLLHVTGNEATRKFLIPKVGLWLSAWLCSPVLVLVEDIGNGFNVCLPHTKSPHLSKKLSGKKVGIYSRR